MVHYTPPIRQTFSSSVSKRKYKKKVSWPKFMFLVKMHGRVIFNTAIVKNENYGFRWPTNLKSWNTLFIIFSSLSMSKLSTWPQPSLLLQIERICQINQDYIITIIGIICDRLSYLRLSAARTRLYITDDTYIKPRLLKCNYYYS